MIVYNIHWALKPAFKIACQLLPTSVTGIMQICSIEEISKFINKDQLSSLVAGGENQEIILGRPKMNGISILDICHQLNITPEQATKYVQQFREKLSNNKLDLLSYE